MRVCSLGHLFQQRAMAWWLLLLLGLAFAVRIVGFLGSRSLQPRWAVQVDGIW